MADDDGPEPDVPDKWRVYDADPTPDPEPTAKPPAPKPKPKSKSQKPPRRAQKHATAPASKPVALLLAGVLAVVTVGVGLVIFAWAGPPGDDKPQTEAGFEAMLADIEEETGDTTIFNAVLYPDYGVVDVRYRDDERYIGYRWDGSLDETTRSTSTYQPFDLADIDPAVIDDLCGPVLDMVKAEGDCYIIISKPSEGSDVWFSAHASDEFGRGGRIEYDLEGNEVARHEPGS